MSKARKLVFNIVLLVVTMLLLSCSEDNSNTSDTTNDTSTSITEMVDCGNDIGNGESIISGPSSTNPTIDNDSIFRAL